VLLPLHFCDLMVADVFVLSLRFCVITVKVPSFIIVTENFHPASCDSVMP
jgi:hypothetical protein